MTLEPRDASRSGALQAGASSEAKDERRLIPVVGAEGARAPPSPPSRRDAAEDALHDVTNALAAARSFADVLLLRAQAGRFTKGDGLVDSLLREIERANVLLKAVRQETYSVGDTLTCGGCGHTFVNRKATGKEATCRRCGSVDLARWRPSE